MHKYLFFIAMLAVTSALNGQNTPKFYAQLSDAEVLQGNRLSVSFILENGEGGQFEAPDWGKAGLQVLGSSQSSSISIQNGVKKVSATYEFTVVPSIAGQIEIPAASIKSNGKTIHTEPVQLLVNPNPEGIVETKKPAKRGALPNNDAAPAPVKPKKRIKTTRI